MPPDPLSLALPLCELYDFVSLTESLGARIRRGHLPRGIAAKAQALQQRLSQAAESAAGEVQGQLRAAATELSLLTHELERAMPSRRTLRARWRALATAYESLHLHARSEALVLPEGRRLAHLKPRNYARNLFHVASGLIGIATYEVLGQRLLVAGVAATIFLGFIALDLGRRISPTVNEKMVERLFGAISRPHEHLHVPSALWYVGALLVGIIWLPKAAIEVGVLVLALGDPAASLVGKRFGRRRLLGEKTLEGSLAFFGVALVFSVILLMQVAPQLGFGLSLRVALGAALAGAVAELCSGRGLLDDNLTVPLAAALAATVLL